MSFLAGMGFSTMSCPPTVTLPAVGGMNPVIMRMVVDFPAPFGPRKPSTSPRSTVNEMPSTARFGPKAFTSLSILIMQVALWKGAIIAQLRAGLEWRPFPRKTDLARAIWFPLSCEVIVIGAGAAGLAAADELAHAGRPVLVLEARSRIGGRCWTRHFPGLSAPVELGAEFIHGRPPATLALLQRAGSAALDSARTQRFVTEGRLRAIDAFAEAQKAMRNTAALKAKDSSFATFLARKRGLSRRTRTFARMMVEGFDAADPSRASARAIVEEWCASPQLGAHFRPAFWEEQHPEVAFFHSPAAAFPTFWTPLPMRAPFLIGWAGGPKAVRLAGLKRDELVQRALHSLKSIFGSQGELVAIHAHDWQADPYARGAYSYVTVGGEGAREALQAPLGDTLYFAGEATDTQGEAGTVAGALQSGLLAARQLI